MRSIFCVLALTLIVASPSGTARVIPDPAQKPAPGNEARQTPLHLANYSPSVNYQLQCLGCHLTNGEGAPSHDIPMMKGFVGNFLKVEGGREFLIQVPGASLSALSNQQLAELLNWMLRDDEIAGGSAPENFKPYTEQEVETNRGVMIKDLIGHRQNLIEKIRNLNIEIPASVIP
ncbi:MULTISPECIES: cytochrome C [unclassified Marinobacter]|jgi:cytochrome c553|uniref:cytochrome C n=1 Tax=unclassified Marinobacter TaxID=83889 RepID=UPI00200F0A47|nr:MULTISPECIES: cytochrome C [unclassified Marinobacter]MCL1478385.1 cytochrome C [Marinobacter sp.]MCL1480340.1 cytochrome C [Marinobacter sp.]MCL1483790.1 cytochrome C [Marinobacter sp.]UQG55448.1 cytochrome C [Marinobacter sp. M4C]UQG64252.1 cytochrome C [Marinobacter sp. M2C]